FTFNYPVFVKYVTLINVHNRASPPTLTGYVQDGQLWQDTFPVPNTNNCTNGADELTVEPDQAVDTLQIGFADDLAIARIYLCKPRPPTPPCPSTYVCPTNTSAGCTHGRCSYVSGQDGGNGERGLCEHF